MNIFLKLFIKMTFGIHSSLVIFLFIVLHQLMLSIKNKLYWKIWGSFSKVLYFDALLKSIEMRQSKALFMLLLPRLPAEYKQKGWWKSIDICFLFDCINKMTLYGDTLLLIKSGDCVGWCPASCVTSGITLLEFSSPTFPPIDSTRQGGGKYGIPSEVSMVVGGKVTQDCSDDNCPGL